MTMEATARDRVYTHCAHAITEAGPEREALFLARLVLLLCEQLADEAGCHRAIDAALRDLPTPSLCALPPDAQGIRA